MKKTTGLSEPSYRIHLILFLIFIVIMFYNASFGLGLEPGQTVASFELETFNSGSRINSQNLFSEHKLTSLIFWTTYCEECLEAVASCNDLVDKYSGNGVGFVSINFNIDLFDKVENFLQESNLKFPVLRDNDEYVAKQYQAHFFGFVVFLVNRDGILIDKYEGHGKGTREDLETLIEKALSEPVITKPGRKVEGLNLSIGNEGIYRFRNIYASGEEVYGAYNEPVEEGTFLDFYHKLNFVSRINEQVSVGLLLRLTNLPDYVVNYGPEYMSFTYGSGYLEYSPLRFLEVRMGYYPVYFSPLTLQRWDFLDNPEGAGGGIGGCAACAGMPGAYSSQSLEQFSNELTFEGAKITFNLSTLLDVTAIYAKTLDPDRGFSRYRQHLVGFNSTFLMTKGYKGFFKTKYSVTAIKIMDEMNSLTFRSYETPFTAYSDEIFDLRIEIDPVKQVRINMEITNTFTEGQLPIDTLEDKRVYAKTTKAGLAEMVLDFPNSITFYAGYLKLDPDFRSPFMAISYLEDRKGYRGGLSFEFPQESLSLIGIDINTIRFSAFLKELKTVSDTYDSVASSFQTFSFGASILTFDKLELSYNYIQKNNKASSSCCGESNEMRIHNASLAYRLAPRNTIDLVWNKIQYEDDKLEDNNYRIEDISILLNTFF